MDKKELLSELAKLSQDEVILAYLEAQESKKTEQAKDVQHMTRTKEQVIQDIKTHKAR